MCRVNASDSVHRKALLRGRASAVKTAAQVSRRVAAYDIQQKLVENAKHVSFDAKYVDRPGLHTHLIVSG
jgi:hypothetical protein